MSSKGSDQVRQRSGLAGVVFRQRNVAPMRADPPSLSMVAAARQLLAALALHRSQQVVVLMGASAAALYWAGLAGIVLLLLGLAATLALVVAAYLIWYGRFCQLNQQRRTLCPRCTSRMWQVSCSCCGEPAAPAALWLGGWLWPGCPSCGQPLSSRGGTLLASCTSCQHTISQPRRFYGKPTRVACWVVPRLPELAEGWQTVWSSEDGQQARCKVVFHNDHRGSAMFLTLCTEDLQGPKIGLPQLTELNQLTLLDHDVAELDANRLTGSLRPRPTMASLPRTGVRSR